MLELTVRLVFSLAVVVGLLLMIARFSARRYRSQAGATITVVQRQALTRSSAVSVVRVGERVLVLGSTEQQVNLLAELDPDELDLDALEPDDQTPHDEDGTDHPAYDEAPVALTILDSPRTVPVPDLAPVRREAPSGLRRGSHRAPGARKAPKRPRQANARAAAPAARGARPAPANTPLAGSILSPDTWRQAMAALRRAS